MKKPFVFLIIIGLFFGLSFELKAQEKHGNVINAFLKIGENARIDLNYEIQIVKNVTISPKLVFPFDFDDLIIGIRADYYFDSLLQLPKPWNIYGGVGTEMYIWEGELVFSVHAGSEYKFHKKWGVIAEIGAGSIFTGGVGMAFHF